MTKEIIDFIEHVKCAAALNNKSIEIIDFDMDRIFLAVDSIENNYTIRMWNVNEEGIIYSLFKNGTITEEIIISDFYKIKS